MSADDSTTDPATTGDIGDLPQHVAMIMDGNGRWAKQRGLTRSEGHREGAKAVRMAVTKSRELGIRHLTLYAFSSQNWSRPKAEVDSLFSLLVEFCENEKQLMIDKGIRLNLIGDRDPLPLVARAAVKAVEAATRRNRDMVLHVAVNYGGREELVRAARRIAEDVARGVLSPADVDERAIESRLWTAGVPDPDLIIRTSGELRVSNFLLWQLAYAEMYVDECLWPDFDWPRYELALRSYTRRERRFGGVG